MKRAICLILIAAILALPYAGAYQLENTNAYWANGVHTEGINNDAEDQAKMLKELGMFLGTPKGFELDRNMTRAEAGVMLVRFLGAEKKVLGGTWRHPFTDVPKWADKYIGWLYISGLTKGVSKTKYAPSQNVTLEQYALFLSRAISGNDSWQLNGVATADEVQLWDKVNRMFSRAAAVGLSVRALSLTYTKNGNYTYSMAQYLADHGVFTAQQLLSAAWGVLPPVYKYLDNEDHIYSTIAGVTVGKTDFGGIYHMTGTDSEAPYFYACSKQGQDIKLYRIDAKTMEETLVSSEPSVDENNPYYTYAATIGGVDYLIEKAQTKNLVAYDGSTLNTVLPDIKTNEPDYFTSYHWLIVAGSDRYWHIDNSSVNEFPYAVGTSIVDFNGGTIVAQLTEPDKSTISFIKAEDGTVMDSYSVPQDISQAGSYRTIESKGNDRYFGEAGLYNLNHEPKQITARPTLDITVFRNDFDNIIILTHEPGERIYCENRFGGNEIVLINTDGTEYVLLGNDPKHGIEIAGFTETISGDAISFYSARDVGMQHFDRYEYVLLPSYDDDKQPQIIVTGFEAGRPETLPQGYEKTYVEKEQARLNALGFGLKQ